MPKYVAVTMVPREVVIPAGVAVPTEWEIWNAPRPLYGHVTWDTWTSTGMMIRGRLWAGIDPDQPDADELRRLNERDHGHLIVFVSEADAFDAGKAALIERYSKFPEADEIIARLDEDDNRSFILEKGLEVLNKQYGGTDDAS